MRFRALAWLGVRASEVGFIIIAEEDPSTKTGRRRAIVVSAILNIVDSDCLQTTEWRRCYTKASTVNC